MPDLIGLLFGSVNVALLTAVNILLILFGTQVVKWALNKERFLWWRNRLYHWDTDRVMPIMPAVFGLIVGGLNGPAPGFGDNATAGIIYAAAAVWSFNILKKTVAGQ